MAQEKETQKVKRPHSQIQFEHFDDWSHIRVVDQWPEGVRILLFEDSIQGELSLDAPSEPVLEYIAMMDIGAQFWVPEPASVLMAGLGTASLWHAFGTSRVRPSQFDIVELDHQIVELAQRYFELPETQPVIQSEFRRYCEESERIYDVIFIDCYSSLSMPAQMMTLEFMKLLSQRLESAGVAVFNLWGAEGNSLWKDQLKTILNGFNSVCFLQCPNDRNLIVYASNQTLKCPQAPFFWKRCPYPVRVLKPSRSTYFHKILDEGQVLTDDNLSHVLSQHALVL